MGDRVAIGTGTGASGRGGASQASAQPAQEASRERGAAALRSPVTWALLGLVAQRPSYGYELVQRFERTYGEALELSSASQVYTALDALERRALIEQFKAQPQAGRQPKPHYRATAAGMEDYHDWLVAQVHDECRRSRLFTLQLALLAPHDALMVLDRYEQACLAHASDTPPAAPAHESAAGVHERLVLEDQRLAIEARLAWIDYARVQLQSHPCPPPRPAQ